MAEHRPSLAVRLRDSLWLRRFVAALLNLWIRFCAATTRWQREGEDALRAQLQEGPVIVVLWHSRIAFAAQCWPKGAPLSTLNEGTAIGAMMADVFAKQGFSPMLMPPGASTMAQMRTVLKRLREDRISIGIAADGPAGPARELKPVPVDWARIAGVPVWGMAISQARSWRLGSWDRTLFPRPFTRGAMVLAPWEAGPLARKPTEAERAVATASLTAHLDAITDRADAMLGEPRQP
ncbi:lysophospholipid acyltransferase family protein [Pseudoroseicyclus sp. H15]